MYGTRLAQRDLLRRSRLFACLGDSETDAILEHANVAWYAVGTAIFAKGDPGNSMMAVLKGRVQISTLSADGRQMALNIMYEGEVFGEIALLDGRERTADATALTECELLIVQRRPFLELLKHRSDVTARLLVVLCERLRHFNEQVEDLAFLHLEGRIAKTLLRLAHGPQSTSATSRIGIRISQRALGELAGGSRESVNKHLQEWKRSGLIEIERGSIVICDRDGLAACL